MITPEELGTFIANRRKLLGLKQKELAEMIHVTDKAISKWERGHGYPDIQTLEALADALYVSLPEMFGISEEGNNDRSDETIKEKEPNSIQQIMDAFEAERAKYQKRERFKAILLRIVIAAGLIICILYLCPWPKKITKTLYGETWENTNDGEIVTFLPYRAELNGYVLHYFFRGDYYLGDLEIYDSSSSSRVFSCHFDGKSSNSGFAYDGALKIKGDFYYHEGIVWVTQYGKPRIREITFYSAKDFSSLVILKVLYSGNINADYWGEHVRYVVRPEELSD